MLYRELPMPQVGDKNAKRPAFGINERDVREALRLREQFRTAAYEDGGVLRWKSNDRCVPMHCFEDAFCEPPALQQETVRAEDAAAIADYIARNKGRQRSPEELFEMRAAFGEGATVVDVLTGDRTQL